NRLGADGQDSDGRKAHRHRHITLNIRPDSKRKPMQHNERNEISAPDGSRVEIVSYHNSDANTDRHLLVNGTELIDYSWTEAEPAAGHDIDDWRESRDTAMRDASQPPS